MKKDRTFGVGVILTAFVTCFNLDIIIVLINKQMSLLSPAKPRTNAASRPQLLLFFSGNNHYDCAIPKAYGHRPLTV